jgi:hypothetical protein
MSRGVRLSEVRQRKFNVINDALNELEREFRKHYGPDTIMIVKSRPNKKQLQLYWSAERGYHICG